MSEQASEAAWFEEQRACLDLHFRCDLVRIKIAYQVDADVGMRRNSLQKGAGLPLRFGTGLPLLHELKPFFEQGENLRMLRGRFIRFGVRGKVQVTAGVICFFLVTTSGRIHDIPRNLQEAPANVGQLRVT